jgi:hypothetical protein
MCPIATIDDGNSSVAGWLYAGKTIDHGSRLAWDTSLINSAGKAGSVPSSALAPPGTDKRFSTLACAATVGRVARRDVVPGGQTR